LVKVLDMGLVRSLTEDEDSSHSEVTRDGTVVGTPDYMAPEQAKNSSTVDAKADQYSLGCTLYMIISGKPPFPDGTPIDKLLRHQLDEPPNILARVPDLPDGLVDVIHRLMAKKAAERYPDMTTVAIELEPYTTGKPLPARSMKRRTKTEGTRKAIPEGSTIIGVNAPLRTARKSNPVLEEVEIISDAELPLNQPIGIPRPLLAEGSGPSFPAADTVGPISKTRKLNRKKKKSRGGVPPWAIGVTVGCLLLTIGIIAYAITHRNSTETPRTPTNDPGNTGGPSTGTPVSIMNLPPAGVNVPEGAVGVLVLHPGNFFRKSSYDFKPSSAFGQWMNALQKRTHVDARTAERITVSFSAAKATRYLAVCESPSVGELPRTLESDSRFRATNFDGLKFFEYATPRGEPSFAGFLGDRSYAVSNHRDFLLSNLRRAGSRRNAAGLTPGLLEALPDPKDPGRPLASFSADGQWPIPEVGSLAEFGVQLAIGRVRLVESGYEVELMLIGTSREKLTDFVSLTLPRIYDRFPGLRPFIVPVIQASGQRFDTIDDGRVRLSLTGRWEQPDVPEWSDSLLPQP
ncbi:MAG: serine/threonine-protein kinase, partial [Gemmataceae bacterium]